MTKQTLIRKFFHEIEKAQYDQVIKLFTPRGKIHSPIFGSMDVTSFYKKLSAEVKTTKFDIKNIFIERGHPHLAAVYIVSSWKLKTGKSFPLEGVNIFEFTSDNAQIKSIKFIYDTHTIRESFK